MKKENEELTKSKFKFGRNPLSFIIIIVSLAIIVFAIVVINSYSDTWKKNNVTPFVTKYEANDRDSVDQAANRKIRLGNLPTDSYTTSGEGFKIPDADNANVVKRMNGKDFDALDFKINCNGSGKWNVEANSVEFTMTFKWNENTSARAKVLKPYRNESNVKYGLCLAADWVGFCQYSSSISAISLKSTDESDRTVKMSVKGISYFPISAKTIPFPVKVNTPDLFVFIQFQYETDGVVGAKTETYILKYTYKEYRTA